MHSKLSFWKRFKVYRIETWFLLPKKIKDRPIWPIKDLGQLKVEPCKKQDLLSSTKVHSIAFS